jgi:hypothetical protein
MTSGKGRGEYERILLDSIMCIAYLTSVFGSFTRGIAKYGYNVKGWIGKSTGFWTASKLVFLAGQ